MEEGGRVGDRKLKISLGLKSVSTLGVEVTARTARRETTEYLAVENGAARTRDTLHINFIEQKPSNVNQTNSFQGLNTRL